MQTETRRAVRRLARAIGVLVALCAPAPLLESSALGTALGIVLVFVGLPYAVVSAVDLLVALERDPCRTLPRRAAMVVLSVPVALLGLTSIVFGATIVVWVLYNVLVERLPQFGHWTWWQPFGIAGPLIAFGWVTLGRALRTRIEEESVPDDVDEDPEADDEPAAAGAFEDGTAPLAGRG